MSILGLALLAAVSAGPDVISATGDWGNIPPVRTRGQLDGTPFVIEQVEKVARSRECNVAGVSRRRIDLNVPFLINFDSAGAVRQVVVRKLDCPSIESAMATAVKLMAEKGEYRPTGSNDAGWYRGQLNVLATTH